MKLYISIVIVGLAVTGLTARADTDNGRALYASCAACHGADASGNQALNAPRLNHLDVAYIGAQLNKFKSGARGGSDDSSTAQQMALMAATLADDQAVADVSAYIVSMEGVSPVATIEGDVTLGSDYFNQFCGACHGPRAEGNQALNSPRLVGSNDWYLRAQLDAFREGARGSHPQDKTGRQMRAMAGVLPDAAALDAVVAFIGSLED